MVYEEMVNLLKTLYGATPKQREALDLAADILDKRSCKHCKSNDPNRSAVHPGFYCTNKSSDYYGGYPFRRGTCECFEKE